MKVGVIGAGAWGTALSITVARGGADVVLWSYDGEHKVFENVEMPHNIRMTANMHEMRDMETWLVVTPGAFFRETMRKARDSYNGQPIIICTKGAESATGQFMSEILNTEIPECVDFGVLSGPQFAAEVAQGVPTGSTLAGTNNAIVAGQGALNKLYLEVSDDIIGTQVCGVGKNAVALICGYNSVVCAENERALRCLQRQNDKGHRRDLPRQKVCGGSGCGQSLCGDQASNRAQFRHGTRRKDTLHSPYSKAYRFGGA